MLRYVQFLLCAVLLLSGGVRIAQSFAPPEVFPPDEKTLKQIRTKADELARTLNQLRQGGLVDDVLADIEVFPHRPS